MNVLMHTILPHPIILFQYLEAHKETESAQFWSQMTTNSNSFKFKKQTVVL